MKRKTVAVFMTVLTLACSLSACGKKMPIPTKEATKATSLKETEPTTETATPEETKISQEEMLRSALGRMPYYGDMSKCAMTAEQATAFAQLIADGLAGDFGFRGGYNDSYDIVSWSDPFQFYISDGIMEWVRTTDRMNVIVADFVGNGIPYLYLYSSLEPSSFEIYGFTDGGIKLAVDAEWFYNGWSYLYEDNFDEGKVKFIEAGGHTTHFYTMYSFFEGATETDRNWEAASDVDGWHIYENGTETNVYSNEEYEALWNKANHTHALPYTCLYDMQPCTLEEMINYLNTYASVMGNGQSVPVEINKAAAVESIKHDGTGIITRGEVPKEKIDCLETLRRYMRGENVIGAGGDSSVYTAWGEAFYFGLEDINNDGVQELLLSTKSDGAESDSGPITMHLPPSYASLSQFCGFDSTNKTYMVADGSAGTYLTIYTYDGTSFSELSSLGSESWSPDDPGYDGVDYGVCIENGVRRGLGREEFWAMVNDWDNRHTKISAKSANIHLDIPNIENTFQVRIHVQNSGEWLVTGTE